MESTGWQGIGRPTLHQGVDLVTGLPLVQVTDLALPFDGSTFRLIRTRSGNRHSVDAQVGPGNIVAAGEWWDWTGLGWMASENPILLIDSALPDVVGNNPRTCWLVLDAHHSIPFQLIESTGEYEAPPRFRARLEPDADAVYNLQQHRWTTRPSSFEVSLYDGALRYTFVAVYEEVPKNRWNGSVADPSLPCDEESPESTLHARPMLPNQFEVPHARAGVDPYSECRQPGMGIPHYGLCTRIADRHGHVVEIEYCRSLRRMMDDVGTTECIECRQNCLAKGQIKYIKLTSGGETVWTLLYVHRMFPGMRFSETNLPWLDDQYPEHTNGLPNEANAEIYEFHGVSAMDRIYAFEGDVFAPGEGEDEDLLPCLTISHFDMPGMDGGVDPIAAYNQNATHDIPSDWSHVVRYHYAHHMGPPDPYYQTNQLYNTPLLLKTSVVSANEDGDRVRTTIYKYDESEFDPAWSEPEPSIPPLEMVFLDDDVSRFLASRGTFGGAIDGREVNDLASWGMPWHSGAGGLDEVVSAFASQRFDFEGVTAWSASANAEFPDPTDMVTPGPHGSYIVLDREGLKFDGNAFTVGKSSLRDSEGMLRHYRVLRLSAPPDAVMAPRNFSRVSMSSAIWSTKAAERTRRKCQAK